ncbi:MAG: molybdopterin-dependent oxidoreductase [Acidimicrobiales bacterium]|nr:molybdopterin-dependent oxidoreductase [Acidimicrobiales bacterium]
MVAAGAAGIVFGARVQNVVGNALGSGLGGLLPGGDRFRIYTITNSFPKVSASNYRLQVTGLVERPLNLTLDDLKAMPKTKLVKDFQCVTGWRVPEVHWEGVKLSEVLATAGIQSRAAALAFESYDGADTESLTLDQAQRPDVIVAYRMLDAPITTEHGGPVRLYVAPMYGYKSLKWLSAIRVVENAAPGFWEQNGYSLDAWIGSSNGRSDLPVDWSVGRRSRPRPIGHGIAPTSTLRSRGTRRPLGNGPALRHPHDYGSSALLRSGGEYGRAPRPHGRDPHMVRCCTADTAGHLASPSSSRRHSSVA